MNPTPTVLSPMVWPNVNFAGSPQDLEVQRFGNVDIGGMLRVNGGILGAGYDRIPGNVWFVDAENGDDNNDGRCWGNAFATIQTAINWARYGAATGSLEYVLKAHHKYIYVRPGHYNLTSYISYSGYGMHMIGLGVPGKDYGVSINYDGAITTTGVIAFSGSNLSIHNIHIYCDAAAPAIYMAGGDNNLLDGIVIEGDDTNMTYGVYAPSMKGSWIRNMVIHGAVTAAIYVPGGADKYFIHGGIVNNQIHSDKAGAKGVWIAGSGDLVAYNARITHNYVDLVGGGATCKGIDVDHDGVIIVDQNGVVMATSAVGIEHAGTGVLANQVSVGGTMQGDTSHSVVDDGAKG